MAILKSWEEESRGMGRARADSILTVLRVRGIEVPEAVRARILAEKDMNQLTRWLEKAAVASTIGEVIDAQR